MAVQPITVNSLGLGHRIAAAIIAVILAAMALICLPLGQTQLAIHPSFMPAFGAISLLVDGLTAALLFTHARIARQLVPLRLGAAYLFAAMVTIPHLLAYPGVVAAAPIIGTGPTFVWLWTAWHGGFAVCIIRFVLGRPGPLKQGDAMRTFIATSLAIGVLTLVATAGLPWLPTVLRGTDYSALNTTGVGPAVLILTVAAGCLVLARLRCRDVLALWLTVALFAACLDVALTLAGTGRFSLGWYTARMLSLMTAVCVLFALLSEMMREAGRIAEQNTVLEQMLQTDVLTGLANRRAFDLALAAEWRRAQREQTTLSLLIIDIDWFKGFNDRYGHPAGDVCLRAVGQALAGHAYRPADVAARIGGEEFAIILPATEESGARQVAERLRASVADLLLPHEASGIGHVTVSVGAATIRPYASADDTSRLVQDADHALYEAKAAGRNTVCGSAEPFLQFATV